MSAGTVGFWLKQPDSVRDLVFGGLRNTLYNALVGLSGFAASTRSANPESTLAVWAHRPTFDLIHLEGAFDRYRITGPWTYREMRDTRTIYDVADIDLKAIKNERPHDAVSDATTQAHAVIAAFAALRGGATVK
jgi:hypothetical protein